MKTIRQALGEGMRRLADVSATPRLDAELLLSFAAGVSRTGLVAGSEKNISADIYSTYIALLERREKHEPVAYLTGTKDFWDFTVSVTPSVLIPRPETELVVEKALAVLADYGTTVSVLDAGTGSACIAIALARELRKKSFSFSITAVDNSEEALSVAEKNIKTYSLEEQIILLQSDWFSQLKEEEKFDLIVSNPPYVAVNDSRVSPELSYEPAGALYAGADGLDAIRILITRTPFYLKPGAYLIVEIGDLQGQKVREIVEQLNSSGEFDRFETEKDLAGNDRILILRKAEA